MPNNEIADIIITLWDRTQRVFPKYTPRRLTRWLIGAQDMLGTSDSISLEPSVYPANWAADDSFDPNKNVRWGGGAWG